MHRVTSTIVAGLLVSAATTGCASRRTVTTNVDGVRIPPAVVEALGPDLDHRGWLELLYGAPDRRETTDEGEVLVWVQTVRTHEHRPDPHDETTTIESRVLLDAHGTIVRAWQRSEGERRD